MKTRTCIIKKDTPAGSYFGDICRWSKALRNTTNFYIRNTYTGIMKPPEERTNNETEVLHDVFTGIQKYNEHKKVLLERDLRKARREDGSMDPEAVRKALARAEPVPYPSEKNRMLTYKVLDAVFRFTGNPDYRRLPAQVNQNAMKKTFQSWKGYFAALRDWKENPGKYTAKPRIPGYIRTEETTASFTNQTARLRDTGKGCVLSFIGTGVTAGCGDIPGTYIKTEVQPYHGEYRLLVTYDDKAESPEVPERPVRIYGIDMGVDNFIAAANNFGGTPFLIKGGAVKSWNRWYNRKKAALTSELTRGKDSRRSVKNSRRRKKDNQNFVSIPERKFLEILAHVGAQYGIPVVIREESYTSQASAVDLDDIPAYGKEDGKTHNFSGKRIKRGLYRTRDGHVLNADINGAANILDGLFLSLEDDGSCGIPRHL